MTSKTQKNNYNKNALDIEEELIQKQNNKLRKHYLKPTAKAFIHKFTKIFRGD